MRRTLVAAALAAVALTACRHDGRDMKPPTFPPPATTTSTTVAAPLPTG